MHKVREKIPVGKKCNGGRRNGHQRKAQIERPKEGSQARRSCKGQEEAKTQQGRIEGFISQEKAGRKDGLVLGKTGSAYQRNNNTTVVWKRYNLRGEGCGQEGNSGNSNWTG